MSVEEVLSSVRIHEGNTINLRVDTVRVPSGKTSTREVVEHRGAVAVLPIDAEGRLLLVRQYRLPARAVLLEVPAGGIDPDEEPGLAAHRELREETGYDCRELSFLFRFFVAPGYSEEEIHCFIARDLFESDQAVDSDEIFELVRMTPEEAANAVERGDIVDGKSIAMAMAYGVTKALK